MTMWHTNLITPVQRMEYNDKQFLRTPEQLLGTGTGFWGPPASAIKEKLPEDYGGIKLVELGVSAPDAHGFAKPNTLWVVGNGPERGIWVLNVSDNYAKEQAERYGHKLMAGWYMKIGPVPFAETLWNSELKKLDAEGNWALYNKVVGRSIAEISAENTERRNKADAEIEGARQEREIKEREQLAKDIKAGKVPASTTTTGGTTGTPVPGSWMVADTTYELVTLPLQGGAPVAVDIAWRAPKSYQWKLTDDPNAGFRLAGRPGAGPYVSGGQAPAAYGLPAYVVGRASSGQSGVIAASALTALFGPDWAKP